MPVWVKHTCCAKVTGVGKVELQFVFFRQVLIRLSSNFAWLSHKITHSMLCVNLACIEGEYYCRLLCTASFDKNLNIESSLRLLKRDL